MHEPLSLQLKHVTISIITGLTIFVFSWLVASAVFKVGPNRLPQYPDLLVIVITSALIAAVVAYGDRAVTGIVNGACLAIFGALLRGETARPHYYGIYVFGVVLGSLVATYPIIVIILTASLIVGAFLIGHSDDIPIFLLSFAISAVLLYVTQLVISKLYVPVHDYLNRSATISLAGFVLVYIFFILFFALIYTSAFYWRPDEAFLSSTIAKSDMSFWFFTYFSTMTIATVGYGEVIPGHPITRLITSVEAVCGTLWLVVYFSFLMRKLSEQPKEK